MPPRDLLRVEVAVGNSVGGDVAARVGDGEAEPELAVGVGRQHGCADAHRIHARPLPESGDAAASGRADEERALARSDAQRLERERRIERAADGKQERHAADDLVVGRKPVDGALAAGRGGKLGEARDAAGKLRHELDRIIAGNGEPRLRRNGLGRERPVAGEAEHDGRLRDRLRKPRVVRGQRREPVGDLGRLLQLARIGRRRQPVRLGQDEVERDALGAGAGEPVDDLGQHRARPRPLPEAGERGLVDVDDAHWERRVGDAGREAQIAVEDGRAQPRYGRRVGDAQDDGEGDEAHGQNEMDRRRAHGPALR